MAVRRLGELDGRAYLDITSSEVLASKVTEDGLDWFEPAEGDWALFSFWIQGTGETETPSVSMNYVVNYLDWYGAEAVIEYWNSTVLTEKLYIILKTTKNNRF